MSKKPFQPEIVDANAEHIHQQYGISEARVLHLGNEIAKLLAEMDLRDEIVMIWGFDQIARLTENPAEYTFCVMTITLALHKQLLQ